MKINNLIHFTDEFVYKTILAYEYIMKNRKIYDIKI